MPPWRFQGDKFHRSHKNAPAHALGRKRGGRFRETQRDRRIEARRKLGFGLKYADHKKGQGPESHAGREHRERETLARPAHPLGLRRNVAKISHGKTPVPYEAIMWVLAPGSGRFKIVK